MIMPVNMAHISISERVLPPRVLQERQGRRGTKRLRGFRHRFGAVTIREEPERQRALQSRGAN
jgi:hypothetical protein